MTAIPRAEHPDPRFQREPWVNLNGPWRFAFDEKTNGEQLGWHHDHQLGDLTITVPYPWESKLSGVARPEYKGAGWYQRAVTIPAEWTDLAPYLTFGAIDWHARVWVNGHFAAENDHGYLPFAVELSPFAKAGDTVTVTVRAFDVADATTLVGKQVPHWYTYSSGIWQTVALEGRAPTHATSLRIAPDVAGKRAVVTLAVNVADAGAYTIRLRSKTDAFPPVEIERDLRAGNQRVLVDLPIPTPQLWSPESPYLYEVEIEIVPTAGGGRDLVSSYFGMRTISRGFWNGNDYEYILLNGEPVYLRGALDQAFHPDGLHSYPSDEVIRGDIALAKELGLNMLRCHIKLNDPRYYYWADKLGLLIMYDIPSPDIDTPTMRRIIDETIPRMMARDFNSPSIFAWVIFNETWGLTRHHTAEAQRWLANTVEKTRRLDPTRLVEDNSVCRFDHVVSDINSWHYYINDYDRVRAHIQQVVDETYPGSAFNYVGGGWVQSTAPLMNSEYGGISAAMGDQDIAWCFKYQTMELRRHAKICGYVYTELDDIEWEHNGFVNYDRSRKEFGYDFFVEGMTVADINSADVVSVDAPPCQTLAAGSHFQAPLFVSHWGAPMQNPRVCWQLDLTDRMGQKSTVNSGTVAVSPQRFSVTDLGALAIPLPNQPGLATVALWLEDDGGVRCRNYVNVEVSAGVSPAQEKLDSGWALRFAPGHCTHTSWVWPRPNAAPDGSKFAAQGSGDVEYELPLPADLNVRSVTELRLLFEASARAGGAKVDWPRVRRSSDYPQTEVDKKFPTDVTVSINDVEIATIHLPDDPADARGVLSHHRAVDSGSYGYLTELAVDGATLAQILADGGPLRIRFAVAADAQHRGGFALYGETLGCYPVGPTVILKV